MRHENGVSNVVGCFHVVRIYSFVDEIKVYLHASYIVFLFVKTENNIFKKEIKHVLRAFIAWWKPQQSLWEFSRAGENLRHNRGFLLICSRILILQRIKITQGTYNWELAMVPHYAVLWFLIELPVNRLQVEHVMAQLYADKIVINIKKKCSWKQYSSSQLMLILPVIYCVSVYTTQVNSTFRARWLASSEVISQVQFTSKQQNKSKMASRFRFGFKMSQIKLVFGPLVIQPLWGSVNIHHYSFPLWWIIVE